MCSLVHSPIAHVCELRWCPHWAAGAGRGRGRGALLETLGASQAQPPAPPAFTVPPSRKAHRELALERLKLPRQLADARLTLRVPRLATGEAVCEGARGLAHTHVGPMGHPSVLSPNSP